MEARHAWSRDALGLFMDIDTIQFTQASGLIAAADNTPAQVFIVDRRRAIDM